MAELLPSSLLDETLCLLRQHLGDPEAARLLSSRRLGGRHGAWLLETGAGPFVLKPFHEPVLTYLELLLSTIKRNFLYREYLQPSAKPARLQREFEAIRAWKELDLAVPEPLGFWEGVGAVYRFVPGQVIRLFLQDEAITLQKKLALAEVLAASMYRRHRLADSHRQPDLLIHPDPIADNIVVSHEGKGVWLDMDSCFRKAPLQQLKARELRIFSYHLALHLRPPALDEIAQCLLHAYPDPASWMLGVHQIERRRLRSVVESAERQRAQGHLTKLDWSCRIKSTLGAGV